MEIFGFEGFCLPYGMQKTGTKIPYGFKEMAGNPVRCVSVLVGKEPVRESPTKSKE